MRARWLPIVPHPTRPTFLLARPASFGTLRDVIRSRLQSLADQRCKPSLSFTNCIILGIAASLIRPPLTPLEIDRGGGIRNPIIAFAAKTKHSSSARSFCRSEEHTSELQSLMRIQYAVFCLNKKQKH